VSEDLAARVVACGVADRAGLSDHSRSESRCRRRRRRSREAVDRGDPWSGLDLDLDRRTDDASSRRIQERLTAQDDPSRMHHLPQRPLSSSGRVIRLRSPLRISSRIFSIRLALAWASAADSSCRFIQAP
jgi:hypothetical protein